METGKIYFRKSDGREFKWSDLLEELNWARALSWNKIFWEAKDALVDKTSGTTALYFGQKYDAKYFDFVEKAWNHDHCDICFGRIEVNDIIYESDSQILCLFCFKEFIEPENINNILK
jgi:hypothetical protein